MADLIFGLLWMIFEVIAEAIFEFVLATIADLVLRAMRGIFDVLEIKPQILVYIGLVAWVQPLAVSV